MCEPGTVESEAAEIRVYEIAASEWNQQVVAAWLYGSARLASAVENFDRRVIDLFLRARSRCYTWQEFQDERAASLKALEDYVEVVRKELRQQPLQVIVNYAQKGLPTSQEAADAVAHDATEK